MRTLIVLCAGDRIIDGRPVFLNRHPDGKLLAEKAVEGIYVESYDEIVFTILDDFDIKYNASKVIMDEIGGKYKIRILILSEPTNGPAESVYLTIKRCGISGEFAVRDSLNGIKIQENPSGNFIAGLDLTRYDGDIYNVRSKSFIVMNEQRQILDVIEKRFRSDIISVGLYGFKSTLDFVMTYEKLNDVSYPIKRLYLSNVISYLIGYKQRVYNCVDAYFHEDWGSPETWNRIQKKYATFFVDADKMLNNYYSDEQVDALVERLLNLSEKNISIVLITRSLNINKKLVYEKLSAKNIKCIDFVCNVSYSTEQLLVASGTEINKLLLEV